MEYSKLNSSNINAAQWDDGNLTLTYHHGGAYVYRGVPWQVYHSLINAESAGKFFHAEIKGKYEFEKVTASA